MTFSPPGIGPVVMGSLLVDSFEMYVKGTTYIKDAVSARSKEIKDA